MNQSQSPHTIEPMIVGALEAEKQQIFNYLNSCPLGAPAPVMAQWISGLDPSSGPFSSGRP